MYNIRQFKSRTLTRFSFGICVKWCLSRSLTLHPTHTLIHESDFFKGVSKISSLNASLEDEGSLSVWRETEKRTPFFIIITGKRVLSLKILNHILGFFCHEDPKTFNLTTLVDEGKWWMWWRMVWPSLLIILFTFAFRALIFDFTSSHSAWRSISLGDALQAKGFNDASRAWLNTTSHPPPPKKKYDELRKV